MPHGNLAAKTIAVTGATGGIGLEIARSLASTRATVLLHGRTADTARQLCAQLTAEGATATLLPVHGDLADSAAIDRLCDQIEGEVAGLDVLIGNAGVFCQTRQLTTDGAELTFAVNVRAPLLMVRRLAGTPERPGLLRRAPGGRVVTVSSRLHWNGEVSSDDLHSGQRLYSGFQAYASSKLMVTMLTAAWAAAEQEDGVTFYSAHPGWVASNLTRSLEGPLAWLSRTVHWFALPAGEGAQNILYPALADPPPAANGSYFSHAQASEPHPLVRNTTAVRALERRILAECGVAEPEPA